MTEKSFFWNGTSLGDAATWTPAQGYHMANVEYESPWVDIMMRAILNGTGNRGVLLGWLNELEVTGVASPISVNTGAAIIYGLYYENDAALNVTVDTPTSDIRVDRLVIRRDWTAQTARVTLLEGVEGAGAAPAMTQSSAPDGSGVYDIPLATLEITTGGVITVTDAREFCEFSLEPADGALGTTQLIDESVDWTARDTRTKKFFLGGGDLEPAPSGSKFTYGALPDITQSASVATWGASAASIEGWQISGAGSADHIGLYAAFKMPGDYAGGPITLYTWWADDCGNALDFYINTYCQRYDDGSFIDYTNSTTRILDTYGVDIVVRTQGASYTSVSLDQLFYVLVDFYTVYATDSEAVLCLGLEVEYTGYL